MVDGVLSSRVGYTGGTEHGSPPTYETVCARNNTFTEAVRLHLDTSVLSFEELMRLFVAHPRVCATTVAAERSQTRIAVWPQDASQERVARRVLAEAGKADVVMLLPPSMWYDAEEYHQDFMAEEKDFPDWSEGSDDSGPGTAWGL